MSQAIILAFGIKKEKKKLSQTLIGKFNFVTIVISLALNSFCAIKFCEQRNRKLEKVLLNATWQS